MKKQPLKPYLNPTKKDTLFSTHTHTIKKFEFNKDVSQSFDDMLLRSIPFYTELQKIILNSASEFTQDDSNIIDCGCSTGTTLALLADYLPQSNVNFVGLDYSQDMLDVAQKKLASHSKQDKITLTHHDLNNGLSYPNSSIIILNLVLQFIPIEKRYPLLIDCFKSLNKNGALLLIEKINTEYENFQPISTHAYETFKLDQGYSKEEIANKKAALKNVLIPLKQSENINLLKKSGFSIVETLFQWYNFCAMIAIKN